MKRPDGDPRSPSRSSDSRLMRISLVLMMFIMALGAVVLYLKLRPAPQPASLDAAFLDTARELVKGNPEDPAAHTSLGIVLLRTGDEQGAEAEFERAIDLDKKYADANLQLGLLIGDSDPERAEQLLVTAAKNSASAETPYLALGDLLYEQGKYKAAKEAYVKSIAIDPILYDSRIGLAKTYEALKDKKLAVEQYKEALRFLPGDKVAREGIDRLTGK